MPYQTLNVVDGRVIDEPTRRFAPITARFLLTLLAAERGYVLRNPDITWEPLFPDVPPPTRATDGSAGHDVAAYLTPGQAITFALGRRKSTRCIHADDVDEQGRAFVTLLPGETALIPLGFKARLPAGHEAQVRPKSGIFRTDLLIPNSPGTIDEDYAEEWMVAVRNIGDTRATITHGTAVAQLVIAEWVPATWTVGPVTRTTTRAGGFGHTTAAQEG